MATIGALPRGWECKLDTRTNRHYFIHHATKQTTWEDPRLAQQRAQQQQQHQQAVRLQQQHHQQQHHQQHQHHGVATHYHQQQPRTNIPMQDLGSSTTRTATPVTNVHFQESPLYGRSTTASAADTRSPARPSSASSYGSATDPVLKIQNMFPTVSRDHIESLLQKYYNRENLVISALQVEKHPLATPPKQGSATPRESSPTPAPAPIRHPQPLKPHSSPKMKLRYLKNVFPGVEETMLLDVLNNSDNNVQTASYKLCMMGYEKREVRTTTPSSSTQSQTTRSHTPTPAETQQQEAIDLEPPKPKVTNKLETKNRLGQMYRDVSQTVLSMALESADYDEEKTKQILDNMGNQTGSQAPENLSVVFPPSVQTIRQHGLRSLGGSTPSIAGPPVSQLATPTADLYGFHKSPYAKGPDPSLRKGPSVHVRGGSSLAKGPDKSLRNGPQASLRSERASLAQGPDPSKVVGPIANRVKGSSVKRG